MHRFALLLDFDGTLADSLPLCMVALRAALLRHTGRIHADREIVAHFGCSEEGIFRRLVPSAWERALASYLEEYERSHHHLCPAPFPRIVELLASLRQRGVRLGVVTGKGRGSALISLRKLGLLDLVDELRTGSPDGDVKAQQILELVRAFEVDPEHAAYAGDFPADVRASRAAGVRSLAAAWAPGVDEPALLAEHPDALFHSTGELMRWVEGWLAAEAPGERAPATSSGR
jgi:phosphoglycolate phosphatase/pyrophosphatase PpaX